MFPIPKLDDMIMELDRLGFCNINILANVGEVYVQAVHKDKNLISNGSSTIETAVFGLIEVAKAYNSFDEKTKQKIKQAQQNEVR